MKRINKTVVGLIFYIILISYSCVQQEKKIYVSLQGDDNNAGSIEEPYLSIKKAVETATGTLSKGRNANIIFRQGQYAFNETLVIIPKNTPGNNNKLIFKAYDNEKVVFSAGVEVKEWTKPDIFPEALPEKSKGHIWVAEIPECKNGNFRFKQLFKGDEKLKRARSKGFLPTVLDEDYEHIKSDELHYPDKSIRNWENLKDIEIIIRVRSPWTMNILPLKSVDENKKIAYTAIPATYKMTQMNRNEPNEELFWVENALDYLDEPGEWVLDSKSGKLYYWPENDIPGPHIYYPLLQEIIRLEGDDEKESYVRNIMFRGITFTHGERDTWAIDDIGLQHDWEIYNKSNALIRFTNTENCIVENCEFMNSGGTGVRFDFHSMGNKVSNSEFHHLGGTAILLCGYGPGTKDVNNNNTIVNNEIHNIGEEYWHSPGIFIWQSGENKVAHNLIYNMPYSGIVVSGPRPVYFDRSRQGEAGTSREILGAMRWDEIGKVNNPNDFQEVKHLLHARNNIIEFNEIHNVVLKMSDGNAIYLSGNGEGTIVRNNYVHDLYSHGIHTAVRSDDFAFNTTFKNNIIYKFVSEGLRIKNPGKIINNYIIGNVKDVSPRAAVSHSPYISLQNWGAEYQPFNAVIARNICYHLGSKADYPNDSIVFIAETQGNSDGFQWPALIEECKVDSNLYYCPNDPEFCKIYLNAMHEKNADKNGLAVDPMFEGFEDRGFKLAKDSPALKAGIQQIDFEKIGLLKNSEK